MKRWVTMWTDKCKIKNSILNKKYDFYWIYWIFYWIFYLRLVYEIRCVCGLIVRADHLERGLVV